MVNVLLSTITFALVRAAPSLLLSLALFSQSPPRSDAIGDFIVVFSLAAMTGGLSALGFLIPTVLSESWRRLTVRRGVTIAALLGIAAPIAGFLVAAVMSPVLLPLFRSKYWLAAGVFHGLPGVVLGAVAVVIAGSLTRRDAKRSL